MINRFNGASIDSTNTTVGAKSLWKKVSYDCLKWNIYYNSTLKLYTMDKSRNENEAIANAA